MANNFTRIQTTKSRYLEAENQLAPLTMLTGPEALTLAKAGQELTGTNEELIYKYRDEFLHIQRAAENGLTTLSMLVENPSEFGILATAWGFTATVRSRFDTKILYTKNLAVTEATTELSNITIDWSKPSKPTIDVDYYRTSGNAVLIDDSTLAVPVFAKLDLVKRILGIDKGQEKDTVTILYTQASTGGFTGLKPAPQGSGAVIPLNINAAGSYVISYFPTQGGRGYRVGDEILVYGNDLGGTSGSNAVFQVRAVDAFGAITNVSVVGTASSRAQSGQILIQLLGNNLARIDRLFG
jgi:hypothetical protein